MSATMTMGETKNKIKFRIYSDIDGVYNLFTPPFPHTKHVPQSSLAGWSPESWRFSTVPTSEFEQVPPEFGKFFHLCWSTELIELINELIALDLVEFVFATTWRKRAQKFAKIVGLNVDGVRFLDADWNRITDKEKNWWKLEAIQKDLIDNPIEKFMWLDDEFPLQNEAVEWCEANHKGSYLIVSPEPTLGITSSLFDTMRSFVLD